MLETWGSAIERMSRVTWELIDVPEMIQCSVLLVSYEVQWSRLKKPGKCCPRVTVILKSFQTLSR